jgi:hypothetical protein
MSGTSGKRRRRAGDKVRKLSKSQRLVLRLAVYIEAMGSVPIGYKGQSLRAYATELQQQYARLKHQLGPEVSSAARISGRTQIRQEGFAEIRSRFVSSGLFDPVNHQLATVGEHESKPSDLHREVQRPSGAADDCRREQVNCRCKLRHITLFSAWAHARQLQDPDLHVYLCPVCDGLHVGHEPNWGARRRRRLKKLRSIDAQLKSFERQRDERLTLRTKLLAELDRQSEGTAPGHSEQVWDKI